MKINCLKCGEDYEQDVLDMVLTKYGKITNCPLCGNKMTMIKPARNLKLTDSGQLVKKFPGAKK